MYNYRIAGNFRGGGNFRGFRGSSPTAKNRPRELFTLFKTWRDGFRIRVSVVALHDCTGTCRQGLPCPGSLYKRALSCELEDPLAISCLRVYKRQLQTGLQYSLAPESTVNLRHKLHPTLLITVYVLSANATVDLKAPRPRVANCGH